MRFIKTIIFSCVKNAFLVFENTLKFLDGKSCAHSNDIPQHKKNKKIIPPLTRTKSKPIITNPK